MGYPLFHAPPMSIVGHGPSTSAATAVSESFFKTLKTEWLYHVDLIDLDHAERELFEYIEMFYNNQRLHAYLDYVSPALFERLSLQKAA